MQANEDERVGEALWDLAAKYPNARFAEDNHQAYLDELGNFPSDAVLWALKEAGGESPQFMPAAPAIASMTRRRLVFLNSQRAQRTFEQMSEKKDEKPATYDEALQEFYQLCDKALAKNLGDEITAENKHVLFGILAVLGKIYGFKSSDITDKRSGIARGLIWSWCEEKFDAYRVINALRGVPATFKKFPTEGMIRAVIKDEPLNAFPAGWVHPEAGGARAADNEPTSPTREREPGDDDDVG